MAETQELAMGPCLPDGCVVLTSLEAADDEIRAGKFVTRSWIYSFASGKLTKLLEASNYSCMNA